MATLDQINQGIVAAAQRGDVESARTLKAARDNLMASSAPDQSATAPTQPAPTQPTPTRYASATPTGFLGSIQQMGADVAGRTGMRFKENLDALNAREAQTKNQGGLAGLLQEYNPLKTMADVGNIVGLASSPVMGIGDVIGTHVDSTYGKPGSAGGEERKYGDLAAALMPLPGKQVLAPIEKGAQIAKSFLAPAVDTVRDVATLGPQVRTATSNLNKNILANTLAQSQKAAQEAAAAKIAAQQALDAKAIAEGKSALPPVLNGNPQHLSEQGAIVRTPAVANLENIKDQRSAADETLRSANEDVVSANEANGRFINNEPSAVALSKDVDAKLNPPLGTSPTATAAPTKEVQNVYRQVSDALKSNRVELSPEQAKQAQDLNYKVETVTNPGTGDLPDETRYYRTFQTPFDAIDALRRRFGEVYQSSPGGFPEISREASKDMYKRLQQIQNDYTSGAHQAVQDNWRAASNAVDQFDTNIGNALTGTQGATGVPTTPTSQLMSRITNNGFGGLQETAKLAGVKPTVAAMRENLKTELNGLDFDAANKKLNPGSNFADAYNGLQRMGPEGQQLYNEVQQHLQQLNDAKMSGVEANELGNVAKTSKDAESKALENQVEYTALHKQFSIMPLSKLNTEGVTTINGMAKNGLISQEQHDEFLNLLQKSTTLADRLKARNEIIKKIGFGSAVLGGFGTAGHVVKTFGRGQ